MPVFRALSRRDAVLILLGGISMQIFTSIIPFQGHSIHTSFHDVLNAQQDYDLSINPFSTTTNPVALPPTPPAPPPVPVPLPLPPARSPAAPAAIPPAPAPTPLELMEHLPQTTVVSHAPGWTLFKDIYMAGGTLFVVSAAPKSAFPDPRYMISNPIVALNTPENIAAREPDESNVCFIPPETAQHWWGGEVRAGERNRVWTIEGGTMLNNDPVQFLDHYYHFIGEFLLGAWSFWLSAFTPIRTHLDPTVLPPRRDLIPSPVNAHGEDNYTVPAINRLMFANVRAHEWRDKPGFNAYFLRAAFPSVDVEVEYDWADRVAATSVPDGEAYTRAWHFEHLLLHDRSAAFRGDWCGGKVHRIAAEAIEKARGEGRLAKTWWTQVRHRVLRFAGAETDVLDASTVDALGTALETALPRTIVVTYLSRQDVRRRLLEPDHAALVRALEEFVAARNAERAADGAGTTKRAWELHVAKGEAMTKDEQVRLFARTSILLGVHGNGLTHVVMMPPSPVSTLIEMFYPGGFAHDYEWTAKALGHRYYGTWNDTYFTEPNIPDVAYVEGFQGTEISITPSTVIKIIEDRVAGHL